MSDYCSFGSVQGTLTNKLQRTSAPLSILEGLPARRPLRRQGTLQILDENLPKWHIFSAYQTPRKLQANSAPPPANNIQRCLGNRAKNVRLLGCGVADIGAGPAPTEDDWLTNSAA